MMMKMMISFSSVLFPTDEISHGVRELFLVSLGGHPPLLCTIQRAASALGFQEGMEKGKASSR